MHSVRPDWVGWPSLLLWPPVCIYAAFIFLSIPSGQMVSARTALLGGAVLSVIAIGWSVHGMLAYGYWWLDDAGLRRGRISTLSVPFRDIESYVVGMPDRLPLLVRLLNQVPTEEVAVSMRAIHGLRHAAIVLRLRGNRLLPTIWLARTPGAEAFRAALLAKLAGKEQPGSSYTDAEIAALARHTYHRVIELG